MKNNETGEFELVLGNKQLLSGFFIVVILFGVFFTMGYIVGRNSAPSQRMTATEQAGGTGTQEEARPQSASGAAPTSAAPVAEQPPANAAPDGAAGEPPQPVTQPVQDPNAPAAAPAQPAQTPAATPPASAATAAKLPNGLIEPTAGDVYLQVMAVKRPEAEVVLKTLRDKNFRAVLAHGPNELVRVLVGPFSDTAALGQAKAGLENAGFHPIVRK
ncbi:MAG TPA: SPOR domain-containing protein [Bryobacteraceae bacterium]|nr:SPOR domain-containing protein [Bryobacteraceae bacterium]